MDLIEQYLCILKFYTMPRKMDQKLVAIKQRHEMEYLKKKYGVPFFVTKDIVSTFGRGKAKVYDALRQMGYPMPAKRIKKARG